MHGAASLTISSLSFNHHLCTFLHYKVHEDSSDSDKDQYQRIDYSNHHDYTCRAEHALNHENGQDRNHKVENDQVFGETSDDTPNWVRIEEYNVCS